jgi:DNA-binding response OmpR family regulator
MTYRNSKILLTENETVILEYILNQKDYCSLDNIFIYLNKQGINIHEDSLRVCISRLRKKILKQTGLDIIKNRYGIGYYISI